MCWAEVVVSRPETQSFMDAFRISPEYLPKTRWKKGGPSCCSDVFAVMWFFMHESLLVACVKWVVLNLSSFYFVDVFSWSFILWCFDLMCVILAEIRSGAETMPFLIEVAFLVEETCYVFVSRLWTTTCQFQKHALIIGIKSTGVNLCHQFVVPSWVHTTPRFTKRRDQPLQKFLREGITGSNTGQNMFLLKGYGDTLAANLDQLFAIILLDLCWIYFGSFL